MKARPCSPACRTLSRRRATPHWCWRARPCRRASRSPPGPTTRTVRSTRSWAFATAKADEPPKHAAPAMPSPIYVALDPFTVTLRDNYNRRILYTAITLRVTDQTSSKLLSDYMPEVRSRVLLALSDQKPQPVQTPEGRPDRKSVV